MSDNIRFKILNTIEQFCMVCVEKMYRLPSSSPSLIINGQNYQWNDKIDLINKTVGIIGCGASAM